MPNDSIEQILIQNLDKLRTGRSNADNIFQDITDYIAFNRGDFTRTTTAGEDRADFIFDTTAIQAKETLTSILHSGLTDTTQRWFSLRPKIIEIQGQDFNLLELHSMKLWLDRVHNVLFNIFKSTSAGFAQQNHQYLMDLVTYGTAVMWVEEDSDTVVNFQTRHIGEVYIEEDSNGFVDTVYREFSYTARQAAQDFGEENLGRKINECLKKDPHKKFKFIHVVMKTVDFQRIGGTPSRFDMKKQYISVYLSLEDKKIVRSKGFFELPYTVARWEKLSGEVWGRSPGWNVIRDVMMLNIMEETSLKIAQKQGDPPLMLADDGVMFPLQAFPGGVIIGGVNDEGRELVKPLQTNARPDILDNKIEQKKANIREAFFVDKFSERQGVQPLTATEVRDIQETRLRMIGPMTQRIQAEYLNKVIDRVFGAASRRGLIPELPEDVLALGVSEVDFEIEYISPLAFTQKSNKLQSLNRFFAATGGLLQVNPELIQVLKADDIVRDAAENSGIPVSYIKTEEELNQERQAQAEVVQQQQLFEQVTAGAETAATLQKAGISVVPEA